MIKDYLPVSILPILSNIYKKNVLEQITNCIEKKLIDYHYQSGYRKNHSTATMLVKPRDDIKQAMKASEITLTLTDYSKSFYTIDFSVLIKRCTHSKRYFYWIFSYLTERYFMQIDSIISNILCTNFDVPQGSIFGPVLFNLCVVDIKNI